MFRDAKWRRLITGAGPPARARGFNFQDGSRGENVRMAGGWSKHSFETGPRSGGKYLGEGATVWDGEVAGCQRRWNTNVGARVLMHESLSLPPRLVPRPSPGSLSG